MCVFLVRWFRWTVGTHRVGYMCLNGVCVAPPSAYGRPMSLGRCLYDG